MLTDLRKLRFYLFAARNYPARTHAYELRDRPHVTILSSVPTLPGYPMPARSVICPANSQELAGLPFLECGFWIAQCGFNAGVSY